MLGFTLLPLLLAGVAVAQTPPGYSPNVTSHLDIKFGSNTVDPPGERLTKAETQSKPTLATSDPALNGTYLYFLLDPDVNGATFGGAAGTRVVYLHTLLRDFKASTTAVNGLYAFSSSATGPKAYMGPAPPAENPPFPHRYINLLYAQPPNFQVPASQTSAVQSGLNFNITQFAIDAKIGQPVVGNYFTVVG
ncbi:phosphatidylethanolamine-binding protein [Bisporella sp. PMI_857]|nr:phosphatidylethanolamine-binding protein [Bisporella sp. PMI_857]